MVNVTRLLFGPILRLLGADLWLLSDQAIRLINLFTVVEVAVLTGWIVILVPNLQAQVLAAIVLAIGLEIEHLIAGVSGKV